MLFSNEFIKKKMSFISICSIYGRYISTKVYFSNISPHYLLYQMFIRLKEILTSISE